VADVQETPESTLSRLPAGAGMLWIVQLVPFQRSANATKELPKLPGVPEYPTAVHAVADVHDTAVSAL
jgi:hypothetical protein